MDVNGALAEKQKQRKKKVGKQMAREEAKQTLVV
jgi:hypothetical protein